MVLANPTEIDGRTRERHVTAEVDREDFSAVQGEVEQAQAGEAAGMGRANSSHAHHRA